MTDSIARYYAAKLLAFAVVATLLAITLGVAGCGTLKTHEPMMIWQHIADNDGGGAE